MHHVDIDTVELTLDVMKFAIGRITNAEPTLGVPRKAEELRALVGETVTPGGIGGETAFRLFRDVLVKASVAIDHWRDLAFVTADLAQAAVGRKRFFIPRQRLSYTFVQTKFLISTSAFAGLPAGLSQDKGAS
jgi:hypothetical protein